ncbi:hypothetical protein Pden_2084 [Paracoccus denitrificans PD1222]|uniref:Uncharacterized protein n=1 Tax=Paracoccus denitrificans (strain Pd 1222) TaxID=318586 RepID=A1B3T2_PARDP|nr:hypothetical protein Pden_2084 [Paracoccus denitrificans PD1222]
MSLFERPSTVTGRRKTPSYFQWVAAFRGSPRSRDNPVTKTDTKAQGGQKDGSVAADHEAVAPARAPATEAKTLPEGSDDKHTSCP